MSFLKNLGKAIGTICGGIAGATVTGIELATQLGKEATELLLYACAAGFTFLGLATRFGGRGGGPGIATPRCFAETVAKTT